MAKRGRKPKRAKLSLKKDTFLSLLSVILILLVLMRAASIVVGGAYLSWYNRLMVGQLGWAAIILPFILFLAGLTLTRFKWRISHPNTFLGATLMFVGLLGMTRAGRLGIYLYQQLELVMGAVVTLGLFIATIFIGYLIITNSSIEELLGWFKRAFVPLVNGFKSLGSAISAFFARLTTKKPGPAILPIKPSSSSTKSNSAKPKHTQPTLTTPSAASTQIWKPPSLDLLGDNVSAPADRGDVKQNAEIIERTLDSFNIRGKVVEYNPGPAVTQYAIEIKTGTKLSKITALQNDLALALAAPGGQIRIEAPIPGRRLIGVEVPNRSLEVVGIKGVLESKEMKAGKSKLSVALGLDVTNQVKVVDIAKMPHVLIAGATGSGKSVCINTFLASMLFNASPAELNLILVDPKRVELTPYNGIPHLLTPVIVEPKKVVSALKWSLAEMERRYKLFAEASVRNLAGYNDKSGFQALPYIVIVIDELADIMLFAPSEVEDAVTRISQMARATGIHLVLATQRPSVDVITGLIKANIPTRISFNVTSVVDSRVILDSPGAEKLLGRGDMLYVPPDQAKPVRIQGTFISDKETHALIKYLKHLDVKQSYDDNVTSKYTSQAGKGSSGTAESEALADLDEYFDEAVRFVVLSGEASSSKFQRKFKIGYARAARILDQMHELGAVGPAQGSKPREVLIKDADAYLTQLRSGSSA